jgi:hypothetical protein
VLTHVPVEIGREWTHDRAEQLDRHDERKRQRHPCDDSQQCSQSGLIA